MAQRSASPVPRRGHGEQREAEREREARGVRKDREACSSLSIGAGVEWAAVEPRRAPVTRYLRRWREVDDGSAVSPHTSASEREGKEERGSRVVGSCWIRPSAGDEGRARQRVEGEEGGEKEPVMLFPFSLCLFFSSISIHRVLNEFEIGFECKLG